jgi:hypothetical protein
MDTNQPGSSTTSFTPAAASVAPGMFGTKIPSAVAFAAGILLFLLPFAEIRCGGTTIAAKSGLDFALDNKWKTQSSEIKEKAMSAGKEQKGNTQYFIIAALALGIIGLGLSFAGAKGGSTGGIATGILSAGALIGFMIDLKSNANHSLREQAVNKAEQGVVNFGFGDIGKKMNDLKPALAFSPWFYIAVVAFLAAAFFCYKRMQSFKT